MRFYSALYFLLVLFGFLAPSDSMANSIFMKARVLPENKTVDLMVWRTDTLSPNSDSSWNCKKIDAPIYPASCLIRPYSPDSSDQDGYLYWAFLNLYSGSKPNDLSTHKPEQETFFDHLKKPLIVLKQRGDSCAYLILFRNSYAPLAAGKVQCPDLSTSLKQIDIDLAHQKFLSQKDENDTTRAKKVYHSGEVVSHSPNCIDLGIEASVGVYAGMSNDESADPNIPASFPQYPLQRFDFNDFAEFDGFPLSFRTFISYRNIIGLRLGYGLSNFLLNGKILNAINKDTLLATKIDQWVIDRSDYSLEIILGGSFATTAVDIGLYGYMGMAKLAFKERAIFVNGNELKTPGFLKNTEGFLLGVGSDLKFSERYLIGVEIGMLFKSFFMKTGPQPDGTGNEFQLRFRLGGMQRFMLGE